MQAVGELSELWPLVSAAATGYIQRNPQMKPRSFHKLSAHAPTDAEITEWIGSRATDEFGKSVGRIEDVYRVGEKLQWLLVRHRRSHHFLAPVRDAVGSGGSVFLPYTAEVIETAPEVVPGEEASEAVLKAATDHYGIV